MRILRLVTLLVLATLLLADGGMVILREQRGPYTITMFASPAPPRAGNVDLSVLVQSNGTLQPVLDARVEIELSSGSEPVRVTASHDKAQNKLLYVATAPLTQPGRWNYRIVIDGGDPISVSGDFDVATETRRLDAYIGYIALPFGALALLAVHQWLRRRPGRDFAMSRES